MVALSALTIVAVGFNLSLVRAALFISYGEFSLMQLDLIALLHLPVE